MTQLKKTNKKQKGSMLVIVIFVLVVMSLLGLTLTRLQASNQDSQTRNVLGAQAWFLAHTGNEWALTQLFPANESDASQTMEERCDALIVDAGDSVALDLNTPICEILSIQCGVDTASTDMAFYKITTTTECGDGGKFSIERSQKVVVRE